MTMMIPAFQEQIGRHGLLWLIGIIWCMIDDYETRM